jgi:hypothetical protein
LRAVAIAAGLGLLLGGCAPDDGAAAPRITAQGFRIQEAQEGALGRFEDIELRVQAPARIDELRVRERSYEVDLARSPEPSHFPLFGLPKRVYGRDDITLNFRGYLNQKIAQPGPYAFEITIRDKQGRTAKATLAVVIHEAGQPVAPGDAEVPPQAASDRPAPAAARPSGLRNEAFRLQRTGKGPVTGAPAFGIDWRTVETARVVIRVTPAEDGATRLARLRPGEYAAIETREQLSRAIESSEAAEKLEMATAGDAASGETFAVVHLDRAYALRTERSETSLSDLGTTVTLIGRYKY